MGYTNDEQMCRVDFFKPSGKWGYTVPLRWCDYETKSPRDTFLQCLQEQFQGHYRGMTAVCLEPPCKLQFPLMVHLPE